MAKVVYIYYWRGGDENGHKSVPIACSNKRVLAKRTGIGYENLVRIFTRERRVYWEHDGHSIIKIYEGDIIRGNQRFANRRSRY